MTHLTSGSLLGGNRLVPLSDGEQTVVHLADSPYCYRIVTLKNEESHTIDDLESYSVFCLSADAGDGVALPEGVLQAGDAMNVERRPVTFRARGKRSVLLVAGVRTNNSVERSLRITRSADHYRVRKPWGHELWLNGEHPAFVLKEVFIRAGNRTSLQYHHFKEETNLLVSGTATLIYKAANGVANDDAREEHLEGAKCVAPSFIHVVPKVVHRLVAESDLLLYEASTPHLDDVVRVHDDSGRQHGRLEQEHRR